MKKLIAGISVFALAFFATGASASTVDGVNDDSSVSIAKQFVLSISGQVSNSFSVSNSIYSGSNTGGNSITADEDVEDASISSGDAHAASAAETTGGDVDVVVDIDADNCGCEETEISDVDDDSDVTVDESMEVSFDVDVTNEGDVDNDLSADAQAGDNSISSENDDVEGADISTGEAVTASVAKTEFGRIMQRISWGN
jgi:hypothetical protein